MSPAPYRARDGHLHFGEVTAPSGVITGDCVTVMAGMPAASVDLVLTDPPYVCRYRDRAGRTVANDNGTDWLKPAFAEIARLMKPDTLCISFYGWTAMASFLEAWKAAGLRPVAHLAFCKAHASRSGHFLSKHESAFALAKGRPPLPAEPSPTWPAGSIPATSCIRPKSRYGCWNRWCAPIARRAAWCLTRSAGPAPRS